MGEAEFLQAFKEQQCDSIVHDCMAVDITRAQRLSKELLNRGTSLPLVIDYTLPESVVELRRGDGMVVARFENVRIGATPTRVPLPTAHDAYAQEQTARLRELQQDADLGHYGWHCQCGVRGNAFTADESRLGLNAHVRVVHVNRSVNVNCGGPATNAEMLKFLASPPKGAEPLNPMAFVLKPTIDRITEIAVKHGLLPEPPWGGMNPRWDKAPEDPTEPLADSMRKIADEHDQAAEYREKIMRRYKNLPHVQDIARMSLPERVEMLNRLNTPLQDAPSAGTMRWDCDTCAVGGGCDTEKLAFDAERAHYSTVEHDRTTETKLRGDVKAALAGVETARTALYDYLKSKNRAA